MAEKPSAWPGLCRRAGEGFLLKSASACEKHSVSGRTSAGILTNLPWCQLKF